MTFHTNQPLGLGESHQNDMSGSGPTAEAKVRVASEYELQADYERAIAQRDRGRLPQSTLDALEYLIKNNDTPALIAWIERRLQDQLPIIREFLAKKGFDL